MLDLWSVERDLEIISYIGTLNGLQFFEQDERVLMD